MGSWVHGFSGALSSQFSDQAHCRISSWSKHSRGRRHACRPESENGPRHRWSGNEPHAGYCGSQRPGSGSGSGSGSGGRHVFVFRNLQKGSLEAGERHRGAGGVKATPSVKSGQGPYQPGAGAPRAALGSRAPPEMKSPEGATWITVRPSMPPLRGWGILGFHDRGQRFARPRLIWSDPVSNAPICFGFFFRCVSVFGLSS
jgi:hypothetical protein